MKKILGIVVITLLIFNNTASAGKWGEGEIQLSGGGLQGFKDYIRGGNSKKPSDFYVTLDGKNSSYWTCSEGSCSEGDHLNDIKVCERQWGKKCKKFAFRRTVKWKNGINTGHYKKSSFKRKWTDSEIENKLNELGFYNN